MGKSFNMLKVIRGSSMVEENNNLVTRRDGRYFCDESAPEEVKEFVLFKNYKAEQSEELNRESEEFYTEMTADKLFGVK